MADLKQLARQIFLETLAAIDIAAVMHRKLWRDGSLLHCGDEIVMDLRAFDRLCVIAIGKAAHAMVEGLVPIIPPNLEIRGVVSAPTPPGETIARFEYFVGGHPIPNLDSWKAAKAILALLKTCDQRTLVFFLLSGGGSALVELPLDSQPTLEDVQQLYSSLVTCGAPIGEIGKVRRHLSAVKGGRLAVAAGAATKITLAVSDVPAKQEAALASGPTLPDPTTVEDAQQVVAHYGLRTQLPSTVCRWIDQGGMIETPKTGDPAFWNAHFSLLLGMDDLFHPAHRAAEAKGCITCCDNTTDDWPVEKAAGFLLGQLDELREIHPTERVALIADGEVGSPVTGDGIGGRNAAFVLSCVEKIAGQKVAVLSAGTDGIDGNSPAAGAVADGDTSASARSLGLDGREASRRSDAYNFFLRLDDAIITGPTGNNLRDLRVLIAEP
jgi:hydroxypyruvate reductase